VSYHIVNSITGKHIGPFTTELDTVFARNIGTAGWPDGRVLNEEEFERHLDDD
jgi:hypothetical protein